MLTGGSETQASSWATVFNLCNSAVGAGVLSFPMAFHLTGWMGGLILCPVVATVELVPLLILANKVSKHGSRTYQGLVRDTLGPSAASFVAWTVFIYLCGACTAFMMICGSSFQALVQWCFLDDAEEPGVLISRWLSITIPATFIILPLSLQPNLTALAATSSLALAVYTFNIGAVAVDLVSKVASRPEHSSIIPADAEAFHWKLDTIRAIPIMIFAYQCHVQSVPIFSEMTSNPRLCPDVSVPAQTDTQRSQGTLNTKLRGIVPVFVISFLQCTLLYVVMGFSGYLLFPTDTKSNILNNFSIKNNVMMVVRILVGFAVALHYPVDLHVARTALYDLVCGCVGKVPVHPAPYVSLAPCTLAIWGTSLVLACLLTDLGKLFSVLGGVACTLIIFILPGLMLLHDHATTPGTPLANTDSSRGRIEDQSVRAPLMDTPERNGARHSDVTGVEARKAPESNFGDTADMGVTVDSSPVGAEGGALNGSRRPDAATQVLGWSLVSLGSCVVCLTVYVTLFG